MTLAASVPVSEETLDVGETRVHQLRGGQGRPVVVLHGIEGPEGWLAFHDALARDATVYAPTHPGFGETARPEWLESITHQALFYQWFLQEAGLDEVDLIGFGIGGWIAAEMATMNTSNLRRLVLVDAAGVRPKDSQFLDIFVTRWRDVIDGCFSDPAASSEYERIYTERPIQDFGGHREPGRSMTMRMCYRPYMHSTALLPMLGRVLTPTLIVWGAEDRVVPVECAYLYQQAIPGAQLRIIEQCGHWPHFEKPQELASIVSEFLR